MGDQENDLCFAGVSATGDPARGVRRELNKVYSVGKTYLHEWHSELANLRGDVTVLCVGMDVGGFPQNLQKDFRERNVEFSGKVIGVDFDPVRIQRLKHAFREDAHFSFLVDDPAALKFAAGFRVGRTELVPKGAFDIAICTYALHDTDVKNPDRALQGLARALKADGFCMVATHARGSFPELLELYRQACLAEGLRVQARAPFAHFDNFAQEDARQRLERWFGAVTFDDIDTSLRFDGSRPDALDKFMQYSDYFPYPALGSEAVSAAQRTSVRTRIYDKAAERMERDKYLHISKPSGVFLCTEPRCETR